MSVLLCTTKYYASTTSVRQSTTPVLLCTIQSTTPVLRCTTKYYASTTPVLQCTTQYYKYYASTTTYYPVLQRTTPVLLCTTKYYASTTKYYASTTTPKRLLLPHALNPNYLIKFEKFQALQRKSFPLIRGLVLIQGLAHNFIITAFALARPALGLVVNLADWSAWEGHGSWVPLSTLGYPKSPKSWGTKLRNSSRFVTRTNYATSPPLATVVPWAPMLWLLLCRPWL